MESQIKLGSTAFRRRTGADKARVRVMEAQGVIAPTKTESGWRQYSETDVQAAIAWLAANSKFRRRSAVAVA
jgi:hypothetical protein